eukprot:UN17988
MVVMVKNETPENHTSRFVKANSDQRRTVDVAYDISRTIESIKAFNIEIDEKQLILMILLLEKL